MSRRNENKERANTVRDIIEIFAIKHGETIDTDSGRPYLDWKNRDLVKQNIVDLLTNLTHLCDVEGLDLQDILRIARIHHEAEAKQKDGGRTRIGNTPTCEDCGESLDHCTCEDEPEELTPLDALRDLLRWEQELGGWEAPCWDRARALLLKKGAC